MFWQIVLFWGKNLFRNHLNVKTVNESDFEHAIASHFNCKLCLDINTVFRFNTCRMELVYFLYLFMLGLCLCCFWKRSVKEVILNDIILIVRLSEHFRYSTITSQRILRVTIGKAIKEFIFVDILGVALSLSLSLVMG